MKNGNLGWQRAMAGLLSLGELPSAKGTVAPTWPMPWNDGLSGPARVCDLRCSLRTNKTTDWARAAGVCASPGSMGSARMDHQNAGLSGADANSSLAVLATGSGGLPHLNRLLAPRIATIPRSPVRLLNPQIHRRRYSPATEACTAPIAEPGPSGKTDTALLSGEWHPVLDSIEAASSKPLSITNGLNLKYERVAL